MAQATRTIVFALLLRSIGKREDRGAKYAGGFEAFLEGYAKCIVSCDMDPLGTCYNRYSFWQ